MNQSKINKAVAKALAAQAETKMVSARAFSILTQVPYTASNLLSVNQGSGPSERDGSSIMLKTLEGSYTLRRNTTSADNYVRVLIVQTRLAEPMLVTDVLDDDDYQSDYSIQHRNTNNFTVLHDKLVTLNNDVPTLVVRFKHKLRGKANWTGTPDAVGDRSGGQIYLFAINDSDSFTTSIRWNATVTFNDV